MLRIPWILVYLIIIVAACIGSNLRSTVTFVSNKNAMDGASQLQNNNNFTDNQARFANVIELTVLPKSNNLSSHDDYNEISTISTKSSAAASKYHFFECNNSQYSKCTYFYPSKFYQYYFTNHILNGSNSYISKSKGSSSSDEHRYQQWRKEIGLENANLPALDSLSWWIKEGEEEKEADNDIILDTVQDYMSLPHNVTYIHVHKCGGTSIQGAMYKRARTMRKSNFHIHNVIHNHTPNKKQYYTNNITVEANMHTYKHSYGGGSHEKKMKWDRERLDHIYNIANTQKDSHQQLHHHDHPIFTIVRDPLVRFLSAVQQVMHYNTEFRTKCLFEPPLLEREQSPLSLIMNKLGKKKQLYNNEREDEEKEKELKKFRQQTIQCSIQDMIDTNYRKDVHLLPIASHFRLLDVDNAERNESTGGTTSIGKNNNDLAVSVFWMDDITEVLSYLVGSMGSQDNTNDATASIKQSTPVYHARDRSNVEYATSLILSRLSIDDCTDIMIQKLCKLYHVDVELMRWLGFDGESVQSC